ncbi:hypothetical protein Tco_0332730 [Tanacetum coccineum]
MQISSLSKLQLLDICKNGYSGRDPLDICDPKLRGQSTPDAQNAADTSSVVSMHQPTSWRPPNHEGCGCNAQGDPPRGLDKVRPTAHHPSPGPTKTMALAASAQAPGGLCIRLL